MRIGELSRRAGVSVDAVRFYERQSLVEAVSRTPGGFREYGSDAVARIADIKALQALGLALADISTVLESREPGACRHVDGTLDVVVARLNERIAQLVALRDRAVATQSACTDSSCAAVPAAVGAGEAVRVSAVPVGVLRR